jgi:hypothetical protein
MVRIRATSDEWARYYEAAERSRASVGDPFHRYVRREALRERLLMIASGLFMAGLAAAFFTLVGP